MIILNNKNIKILGMLVVVFVLLSFVLNYKDKLYNKEDLNLNKINDTNDIFHINKNKNISNYKNIPLIPDPIKFPKDDSNYLRFLKSFEDKVNPEPYNSSGVYSKNINELKKPLSDKRTERRLRTVFELMTENHPDPFNTKPKFM